VVKERKVVNLGEIWSEEGWIEKGWRDVNGGFTERVEK